MLDANYFALFLPLVSYFLSFQTIVVIYKKFFCFICRKQLETLYGNVYYFKVIMREAHTRKCRDKQNTTLILKNGESWKNHRLKTENMSMLMIICYQLHPANRLLALLSVSVLIKRFSTDSKTNFIEHEILKRILALSEIFYQRVN